MPRFGSAVRLFSGSYVGGSRWTGYDVAPDGRFIIRSVETEGDGGTASNIILVQNWFEELKRLVPVN